MAKSDEARDEPIEDEMLPDEREAVAERLASLGDDDRRSLSEVADELGSSE